jgi:hypothetical protein
MLKAAFGLRVRRGRIDSRLIGSRSATSALLRLCRTASRWLHSLTPERRTDRIAPCLLRSLSLAFPAVERTGLLGVSRGPARRRELLHVSAVQGCRQWLRDNNRRA